MPPGPHPGPPSIDIYESTPRSVGQWRDQVSSGRCVRLYAYASGAAPMHPVARRPSSAAFDGRGDRVKPEPCSLCGASASRMRLPAWFARWWIGDDTIHRATSPASKGQSNATRPHLQRRGRYLAGRHLRGGTGGGGAHRAPGPQHARHGALLGVAAHGCGVLLVVDALIHRVDDGRRLHLGHATHPCTTAVCDAAHRGVPVQ